MVKKLKKVKGKAGVDFPVNEDGSPGRNVKVKVKPERLESTAEKAKRLSKEGLNVKEVANILGINKYEASELIKG